MAIFNVVTESVICTVPLNLMVTDITQTSFNIVWDEVGPATVYEVEVLSLLGNIGHAPLTSDTDIVTSDNAIITSDATRIDVIRTINTQLAITDLTPGTQYTIRIRSLCSLTSQSLFTDVITVITIDLIDFRASNATIRISNVNLRISQLQITEQEI